MKNHLLVFLLSILIISGLRAETYKVEALVIPYSPNPPTLSGDLSHHAWETGALLTNFSSITDGSTDVQQTEVRLLYDSKYLYVGVRCFEENMAEIVARVKDRDGPIWQDDCFELLIDTANSERTCYHFAVNSIGAISDSKHLRRDISDATWDSMGTRVKTSVSDDFWTVELAIPFKDLGIEPAAGMVWGLNACRERYAGKAEYSAWSPTPGGFVQPQNFGKVIFGDEKGEWNGPILYTWGILDSDISYGGKNVLTCLIPNNASIPMTYSIALASDKSKIERSIEIIPNEIKKVDIEYVPTGKPGETFTLTVSQNNEITMKTTHPTMAMEGTAMVWQLEDPLFEELLSDTPPGEQRHGAIYWFHSSIHYELRPLAKMYGLRYSHEEAFQELADVKLMPITQSFQIKDGMILEKADKYGFKILFTPDYRSSRDHGVPQIDGLPFILDPKSKEVYFEDLRAGIEAGREHIWAIFTYDEFHERTVYQGVKFHEQMRDSYPFIREVDREVKEQFGLGRYGIPKSLTDDNPYRWIAYRKWVNAQLIEWQEEVYRITKELTPEILVVSMDPIAGHKPYAFDRLGAYADIMTHQLYPSRNPNRQEFGFVTKLVTDLSGKPLWPCTHVENYAFSTTPEDVREFMSQVVRSGGTGFHLYLPDVRGSRASKSDTKLTKYGFPERFRAITEIVDINSRMNEVAIPDDPDLAIFYSEDHYKSFSASNYLFPNEPEYAFTFFGPVARTWFKFVNDAMIERNTADLSRYKAVVVPAAKYQRAGVADGLIDYAQNGGTLICGDPQAFSWDVDGSSMAQKRVEFFGASAVPGEKADYVIFERGISFPRLSGRKLEVIGDTFNLKPLWGVEVLARFEDGRPAVLRNQVGRGSVILFAFNPFTERAVADPAWKSFFTELARSLGLKTGRDIWRFKFPPFETVYLEEPDAVCLTGNFIKWHQERPLDIRNVEVFGDYSYSLAPDQIPDIDENGIEFGKGKLTDRRRAPETPIADLKVEDFIVTWKSADQTSVSFDFKSVHPVESLRLWYSDQLPELTVEGSLDGKSWVEVATHPKQARTWDVLDIELKWQAREFRFVRINFGKRDEGMPLTLVECEVWASRQ